MAEYKELPKRVQRVIDKIRGGEKLCKSFRNKLGGEVEVLFTFEPSGRRAPPKTSGDAIESGLLKALGDGLFGDDTSQTWAA